MRKVLLIEDRPRRQLQFLTETQFDSLNEIENLNTPNADECVKFIARINEQDANLKQYDLIIVHKSSLNQTGLTFLNSIKKDLILFSGGLSQIVYQFEDFPMLSVNSTDLYNSNFVEFLKKYIEGNVNSLSELVYGEKWKLNILLRYRMLKTKSEKSMDDYEKIELEEQMELLKTAIEDFPEDVNKEIDRQIIAI